MPTKADFYKPAPRIADNPTAAPRTLIDFGEATTERKCAFVAKKVDATVKWIYLLFAHKKRKELNEELDQELNELSRRINEAVDITGDKERADAITAVQWWNLNKGLLEIRGISFEGLSANYESIVRKVTRISVDKLGFL